MKLCPQCEFIYEDDQSLCDMDGSVLVYHSGPVALEGSATNFSQRQENPWAAESLSVSGMVPQRVVSETKFEVISEKKSNGMPQWKRAALIAAAVVVGVLVFVVYYISSRNHSSQAEVQDSTVTTPSTSAPSPAPPAADNSRAVFSPSAEELAQQASEAAAANVSDVPDEGVRQVKTVSSSHAQNSTSPASTKSSESADRELATSKSKPEEMNAPKEPGVARHEPVIDSKEPAVKPAAPVAQNQPKVVKPADPKAKKESKVGTFFKKTGRLLKKPFEF